MVSQRVQIDVDAYQVSERQSHQPLALAVVKQPVNLTENVPAIVHHRQMRRGFLKQANQAQNKRT
jgi:hypothetical protein